MQRILLCGVAVLLLAGCDEAIETKVRDGMTDPASAQFKDKVTYKNLACISVNGKNSFGGYVGFKRFTLKTEHGSDWEIISTDATCTAQTLAEMVASSESLEKAKKVMSELTDEEVIRQMQDSKLIQPTVKKIADIKDVNCQKAAASAFSAGFLSRTQPTTFSASKGEFEVRMEAFKKGTCDVPLGLVND